MTYKKFKDTKAKDAPINGLIHHEQTAPKAPGVNGQVVLTEPNGEAELEQVHGREADSMDVDEGTSAAPVYPADLIVNKDMILETIYLPREGPVP